MFEFTEQERDITYKVSSKFKTWWREDVRSVCAETIWLRRDDYNGDGDYGAWMYLTCRRASIDYLRSQMGRSSTKKYKINCNLVPIESDVINSLDSKTVFTRAIDVRTPEKIFFEKEACNLSHIAKKLTPQELEIAQKIVNGMTQQDVAEEMGVTPSRICQIMKPVKEKIKQAMIYS